MHLLVRLFFKEVEHNKVNLLRHFCWGSYSGLHNRAWRLGGGDDIPGNAHEKIYRIWELFLSHCCLLLLKILRVDLFTFSQICN